MSTEPSSDERKQAAALVLASGGNQASAARAANVSRPTLTRWVREKGFKGLVESLREPREDDADLGEVAVKGLGDLVPKALILLSEALDGESYTAQQQRVALDLIKAAANLAKKTDEGTESDLAKAIAELDLRDKGKRITYD